MSGASTSTTGKYTNANFTVSSSDGGSGVQALYMKSPSDSSYSSVGGSSKTIANSSTNGLYSFYAKDNAGNTSSTYYVYLDTSKPTVSISPNKTYTNAAFSASASDTGSGVSYMQYTTPSNSTWTTYTSGTSIAATATNGKYTFSAVDKAGNTSAERLFISTRQNLRVRFIRERQQRQAAQKLMANISSSSVVIRFRA